MQPDAVVKANDAIRFLIADGCFAITTSGELPPIARSHLTFSLTTGFADFLPPNRCIDDKALNFTNHAR